jgi:hypothetical protein
MRRLTLVALVAALVIGPAASASAATPDIERPGVVTAELDFPAGVFCGFPLQVVLVQRPVFTVFLDRDGNVVRAHSTGSVVATVTNIDSGTTVVQRIPGPSFFDAGLTLVRGTGAWSGIVTTEGVAISAWGRIAFDDQGLVTDVRGRTVPLCATLV